MMTAEKKDEKTFHPPKFPLRIREKSIIFFQWLLQNPHYLLPFH